MPKSGDSARKKTTLSEEELFNLRRFFPLIDQFIKFHHYNYNQNNASKQEVHLPSLVLVPKRHLGIQMVLSNSDHPEEVQNLVKENSVKKTAFHAKLKKSFVCMK